MEDTATNIGLLSYMAGVRPSALFEWNDESEWLERLLFDLDVAELTYKVLIEMRNI